MTMRILDWFFVACLVILMAAGCGQESDVEEEPTLVSARPGDGPDPLPPMGEVVIDDLDGSAERWGDDVYELHTAGDEAPAIENDTLTLTVSYSGGCARHDFTLVADDAFRDSAPVQLDVFLAHDANDDPCEAYPTVAFEFDLTPVRALYGETFGTDAGAVVLRVHHEEGPADDRVVVFSLTYPFD